MEATLHVAPNRQGEGERISSRRKPPTVGSEKVPIAQLPEQLEKYAGRSKKPLKFCLLGCITCTNDEIGEEVQM